SRRRPWPKSRSTFSSGRSASDATDCPPRPSIIWCRTSWSCANPPQLRPKARPRRADRRRLCRSELTEEEVRRQDVERLELAPHVMEDALQVLEYTRRELEDEEGATGCQGLGSVAQDALTHLGRYGAERDSRDDVVGFAEAEALEDLAYRLRRVLHHLQTLVGQRHAQVVDEVRVHLDGDQNRIGAHAPQDLRGDDPDPGSVLDDDARLIPVDRLQQLFDQESRARDDRAEHARVAEEIAGEQQGVRGSCPAWYWLVFRHVVLCLGDAHCKLLHYAQVPALRHRLSRFSRPTAWRRTLDGAAPRPGGRGDRPGSR